MVANCHGSAEYRRVLGQQGGCDPEHRDAAGTLPRQSNYEKSRS